MQLKDGGLYETKRGQRFRIWRESNGTFHCRSFGGYWTADGRAVGRSWYADGYRKPHLVVEAREERWVPLSHGELAQGHAFRTVDGHRQKLVTREQAQKIGAEGHARHAAKQVPISRTTEKSGRVEGFDPFGFAIWFDWKLGRRDGRASFDIETSSGVKVTIPC